ncbi:YesL family protein [Demequina capsici]|uniref:YesL family protein n=1 Tax=Demequina capsici TaxID=3075620 RepID=A0AA96FC73_9MICO|nr:YesL family protein [Demequina sp. OYTSA14]WNM25625.1 YesL family protein [Demequina sp. OYTSA14]
MLDRLFRTDSPFWQTMGLLYDVAVVNLLGLVLSIPIITAGPAITAAHDTARRVLEDRGDSAIRLLLHSFRTNLRQGMAVGAVALIAAVVTIGAWLLTTRSSLALPAAVLLTVLVLPTWTYAFAVQARFDNPWHRTIFVAFLLAFANLRWTALALVIDAALVGVAVATLTQMPQGIPVLVIFGYGALIFANTPILERAFRPQLDADAPQETTAR